jgi:LmbE family N-acetylglucosaminyl deacetylase
MLDLCLNLPKGRAPRFLFLGAHCDDIEIGCGGTVIELLKAYPDALIHWVVLSSGAKRAAEARRASQALLRSACNATVLIKDFRDCVFPSQTSEIKDFLEQVKQSMLDGPPDVVFAHFREDLHQDHRVVGELVWNSFRNHIVLEYEIPKFDGGLGSPSFFVPISQTAMKRKIALLMKVFPSQLSRSWFTPETFQGLMRLRGIECNSPSGYAEAFYARKIVLGTPTKTRRK